MQLWLYNLYHLHQYFCYLQTIFTIYPRFKKTMETRIIKNIFNKDGRRCRDVKSQKVYEQGLEVNIGAKMK